jgi:hypothetical protein
MNVWISLVTLPLQQTDRPGAKGEKLLGFSYCRQVVRRADEGFRGRQQCLAWL